MLITLDQQYFITLSLSIVYDDPNIPYSYGNEAEVFGVLAFFVLAVVIGLLIGIGIGAVLCYFISNWLKEVPEEDRVMTPGQVWLLLIPFLTFTGTSACTCTTCLNLSKIIFSEKEIRKSATVAKQWGCGFAYVPFPA